MSKNIIVTGAARGIGKAITLSASKNGWNVIAIDTPDSSLEDAFSNHENITPVIGSVSSDKVAELITNIEDLDMPFHGLINNAAIDSTKSWHDITPDDILTTYQNNVVGPFALTRWWSDRLIASNLPGAAIFITSLHDEAVRFHIDYSLSKAALSQLIRESAAVLAKHHIRINGVRPGAINTWDAEKKDQRTIQSDALIPYGRLGVAEEITEACLFLLDNTKSNYITGQQITVDGGLSLRNWLFELGVD